MRLEHFEVVEFRIKCHGELEAKQDHAYVDYYNPRTIQSLKIVKLFVNRFSEFLEFRISSFAKTNSSLIIHWQAQRVKVLFEHAKECNIYSHRNERYN